MRSVLISRAARALAVVALSAVAACSGGGSSGTSPVPLNTVSCDPGTSVQLARPFPGQTGVGTNTGSIEIVASDNNNQLYRSYTQYDIILQGRFSGQYVTNLLTLTADRTGPQPYASDFYYSGALPSPLAAGDTYNAYLNIPNSSCTQLPYLGSFST